MIHVAVRRRVKPGHEAEFEAAIREFFAASLGSEGSAGAALLRPVPGAPNEYGILRAFEDEAAKERFYASPAYRDWNARVSHLVDGEPELRQLHGLEAFFTQGAPRRAPPRWKMALLTWLGVDLAVLVFGRGGPHLAGGALPGWLLFLLVNACVVASLTWLIMPVLTRAAARWLHDQRPPA
ncbi:MAG TPA: antibiotic biosynthesis monooxygenase [Kofleriaceae bacterium]|nr:antibiotic biosynthesis monooxygenase [Kofleriaceae bacterium]